MNGRIAKKLRKGTVTRREYQQRKKIYKGTPHEGVRSENITRKEKLQKVS